eukprot:CAMPEP_0119319720 /NCGR_PEP_ID=MMETSP1333-20130426/50153_1 /TAXON_ID=418940 /ORGANISM="Scyphosphaera apsteinii, Strain RCC1455" /LENGTH=250 /DNA_ID=CAMNT_0007326199 /DNA_START=92 /DNA_END=844 /DNA_ORIENTATION=+
MSLHALPLEARPLLVQVGANEHVSHHDPAVGAIARGWRAVLLEPMPAFAATLKLKYATEIASRGVRVVDAAVCDSKCRDTTRTVYYFDHNGTRNLGSNSSDPRCAPSWLNELSSFSRHHVLSHQARMRVAPKVCTACAAKLRRPLPMSCLSRILLDNLAQSTVRCMCLQQLLSKHERYVALLMIDAQGHDAQILAAFPFDRVAVDRVVYEPSLLSRADQEMARRLLAKHGFVRLGEDWSMSVWQHVGQHV